MKKYQPHKLKELRIAKGHSRRSLARLTGIHASTICYAEKQNYKWQPRVLPSIAKVLHVSEDYFYEVNKNE